MTSLSQLRTALHDARARMDAIFNLIKPNSWYERPIPERHRLIFYLGTPRSVRLESGLSMDLGETFLSS